MEYFITKNKSLNKKDLSKQIQDSYNGFMKFKTEEKNLLKNQFSFFPDPFNYYPQLK